MHSDAGASRMSGWATYQKSHSGFLHSFSAQIRVLSAIFKREIDVKSGKAGLGFIAGLLEPMLHIGVVCLWHYVIRVQPVYGTSILLFVASGMYPVFVFIHLSSQLRVSARFLVGTRRYPIESPLDFLLSGALMNFFVYLFVGIILFSAMALISTPQAIPFDPGAVAMAMLALACLGFGMGLCNAVIDRLLPVWHYIWGTFARVMILFSGILYVPDLLPINLRDVLVWNPVLHAVGLFRQGFYPYYPTIIYSPYYMWTCGLTLIVFGLALQRLFRRRLSVA